MLSSTWSVDERLHPNEELRIYQLRHHCITDTSKEPIGVARSLYVTAELSWIIYVHGLRVPFSSNALCDIPEFLTVESFTALLEVLQSSKICPGNPDSHFVDLCQSRKGNFLSVTKSVVAFLHDTVGVLKTVRHISCEV